MPTELLLAGFIHLILRAFIKLSIIINYFIDKITVFYITTRRRK